ncbi:MAG: hypothetical protein QNK37_39205 [Acidobacteriota bacterium]|nr:hypothetical protein [Acidobacteriota bacterium]
MKILPVLFFCLVISPTLKAGEVKVAFTFEKRPPAVGLVYMKDDAGLDLKKKPVVDQKNKQFTSKVVITTPDSEIQLKNSDDISHNIYANDPANNVNFDIGLADPGTTLRKKVDWEKDTVVKIGCKIHPQMRAWIANIESRFYSIIPFEKTKLAYHAVLENVPETLTTVRVWLPGYDAIEAVLPATGRVELELIKRGKKKGVVVLSRG